jgi:hypothetical protein
VIKSYGDPDVTPVEQQDEAALKAELDRARETHRSDREKCERQLRALQDAYAVTMKAFREADLNQTAVALGHNNAKKRIDEAEAEIKKWRDWMLANPVPAAPVQPAAPDLSVLEAALRMPLDTAALESKIVEAARTNVRRSQYLANLKKVEQKEADKKLLLDMERQERELRQARLDKLKKLADASGIPGLEFHEDLSFSFQGTSAGMLSTSQLMSLSSAIAALYPEGFGLELIDRAESLGASIFAFVEKARKEDKTILATIVGERPAKAPEEVGVFVVRAGKVA